MNDTRKPIKVKPEIQHALKIAAAQGNTTIQDLVERAVRSLLQSPSASDSPTKPSGKHAHWHDLLDQILTRGNDRQKLGIQSNLEAFVGNLPAAPRVEEEEIVYRPKSAKRRAS